MISSLPASVCLALLCCPFVRVEGAFLNIPPLLINPLPVNLGFGNPSGTTSSTASLPITLGVSILPSNFFATVPTEGVASTSSSSTPSFTTVPSPATWSNTSSSSAATSSSLADISTSSAVISAVTSLPNSSGAGVPSSLSNYNPSSFATLTTISPNLTTTSAEAGPSVTNMGLLVPIGIIGDSGSSTTGTTISKQGILSLLPLPGAASSTATSQSPSPIRSSSSFSSVNTANVTSVTLPPSSLPTNATATSWLNGTASATDSSCISLTYGATWTSYIILPNTTTVTETVYADNISTSFATTPEFTPPVQCSTTSADLTPLNSTSSFRLGFPSSKATTVTAIITSKNGVTVTTTVSPPDYTMPLGKTTARTNTLTLIGLPSLIGVSPVSTTPKITVPMPPTTAVPDAVYLSSTPVVETLTTTAPDGMTVVVSPNDVIIGDQSVSIGSLTTLVTASGVVWTIGPSQIVGSSLTVEVPTTSFAVHEASAAAVTAPQTTNLIVLDGEPFTAIGSSVVILGSSTITYGSGIPSQTSVVNGETITIGPAGVSFDGTTLGGTANPTGTQIGLAGGLSITEVGSTLAIINGETLTVGPSVSAYTTIINGHNITAGSAGLVLGAATLQYPFNPTTNAVTAGGVTFTEIGSSLAVIGGTTYTFGPGATPTTAVINGHTISFGTGGIGFASTTFVSYSSYSSTRSPTPTATPTGTRTAAAAATTTKKSSSHRIGPVGSVLVCVIAWVACMI